MSRTPPEHRYVDNRDALLALCRELSAKPYLVVDTEFLRERTYRPELCLVQLKHGNVLACVDTLAIDDLDPLYALLLDSQSTKVLHAASQDLEIFYLATRRVPAPLFDTQLAAPLLGYDEQIGYANLVRAHLGIDLPKTQTRADWTRRPLPVEQIIYALDDVIHLETLYLDMREKLEALGRLDWLRPEFAAWEDPERYAQPAHERWRKLRGVQRLKGPALAVAQALATWRELRAREHNRPRNWILKDEVLLTLARQQPTEASELGHVRGLDRKARERHGEEILETIREGRQQKPDALPEFIRKPKLDGQRRACLQLLDAWVHQRAVDLDIAPGLLAPQRTLESAVTGRGRAAFNAWQDALLGEDIERLLSGRAVLAYDGQRLVCQASAPSISGDETI